MKQEPVELDTDEDEIRSIADSEWTVETSATNGGGQNASMGKLKSKIRILEVGGLKN
jgi:hypothetical protein